MVSSHCHWLHQSSPIHNKHTSPAEVLNNQRSFVSFWKIDVCLVAVEWYANKSYVRNIHKNIQFLLYFASESRLFGLIRQSEWLKAFMQSHKDYFTLSFTSNVWWLKIASNAKVPMAVEIEYQDILTSPKTKSIHKTKWARIE